MSLLITFFIPASTFPFKHFLMLVYPFVLISDISKGIAESAYILALNGIPHLRISDTVLLIDCLASENICSTKYILSKYVILTHAVLSSPPYPKSRPYQVSPSSSM